MKIKNLNESSNRFMLLSKIYAHYPDLSQEDEDYLNDLPTDKLISEIKNRGWEEILLDESLHIDSIGGLLGSKGTVTLDKDIFYDNVDNLLPDNWSSVMDGVGSEDEFRSVFKVKGDDVYLPQGMELEYVGGDDNDSYFKVVGTDITFSLLNDSSMYESLNEYWDKIEDTPYYKVASKSVLDSDGFWTEYTMYYDEDNNNYFFIFGDSDLYGPDPNYADWECDSNEEAVEWYNNYNGFEDDEDDFEVDMDEAVKESTETSLELDENLFEDLLVESPVRKYSVEEWIDSQGWAPDDVDDDEVAFYATDDGPVCGSKHKDGTYSIFGMRQDMDGLSYSKMMRIIKLWSNSVDESCDVKRRKSASLDLDEDLFEDDAIIPDAIPEPELPEVVTESEPKEETPVMGPDFGIAGLLNKLIVDNWSMNDSYNELIANAESNNMSDIADLVKGIAAEVNNHIGKLQGALATISPNVENISVGEEEAIKELEPQTVEVEAEEIKENYSTELNDRVNSAYSTKGPERTSTIVSTVEKSLNDMHQGMKVDLNGATFERIPEGFKDINTGNKWDTHVLMDMVNSTLGKDGKPPVFSDGK